MRFLLGTAGSGKTRRCLEEIRLELLGSPEGAPLVLLAPKQATFQLERQLLSDPALSGYVRLQIVSFERLARFVLDELALASPALLGEQGRVMVLRSLLARLQDRMTLFGPASQFPGFAREVSRVLRELQQARINPDALATLAERVASGSNLPFKLRELATLLRAYLNWLKDRQLEDAGSLLDIAAGILNRPEHPGLVDSLSSHPGPENTRLRIAGLWMDGFAEMTRQEIELLGAVAPLCDQVTIAFCLDGEPAEDVPWTSSSSVLAQTYRRCRQRLDAIPKARVEVEKIEAAPGRGRFAKNPVLQHLERTWDTPGGGPRSPELEIDPGSVIRLVECADPEGEAVCAAREILRHVQVGGRFRECGVLLRQLDSHQEVLRRVFTRYEIPFFLDRREPVSHHPLAELTRYAIRTVFYHWKSEDWLGALKTGLAGATEDEVDELENAALEHGWSGSAWFKPLEGPRVPGELNRLERLRKKLLPPFEALAAALNRTEGRITGGELADALQQFWQALRVDVVLADWASAEVSEAAAGCFRTPSAMHLTVLEEMRGWMEDLALAFPGRAEALSLRDWLPLLESVLSTLSVGVIPPSLDQVLIGTLDRSRNPDLRLALVLGLNEGLFPAVTTAPLLFTESERTELERQGMALGQDARRRLGHERYYAYIAFTRARDRLVLAWSRRNSDGDLLAPSTYVGSIRRRFPKLEIDSPDGTTAIEEFVHVSEAVIPVWQGLPETSPAWSRLMSIPLLARAIPRLRALASPDPAEGLDPGIARELHGPGDFVTSVSRLEQFAACPFKFLVGSGFNAEERRRFEVDARECGSFQHEVLARFHHRVQEQTAARQWRALTPGEARTWIAEIAGEVAGQYRTGLFHASDRSLFTARALTSALQDFMEVLIHWMRTSYEFEPRDVELEFGSGPDHSDAWPLELGDGRRLLLRGRIDRVDVALDPETGRRWCVVIDYKSGSRRIDPTLQAHGIQIQLPAYLSALVRRMAREHLSGPPPEPAGMFYVSLRGQYDRGATRDAVTREKAGPARQQAYRHHGRFNIDALKALDRLCDGDGSGQFSYQMTAEGKVNRRYSDPMEPEVFRSMLDAVEAQLIGMGRRILQGEAAVDPYMKSNQTACDWCGFRPVCRIDPWTHVFRRLESPA